MQRSILHQPSEKILFPGFPPSCLSFCHSCGFPTLSESSVFPQSHPHRGNSACLRQSRFRRAVKIASSADNRCSRPQQQPVFPLPLANISNNSIPVPGFRTTSEAPAAAGKLPPTEHLLPDLPADAPIREFRRPAVWHRRHP